MSPFAILVAAALAGAPAQKTQLKIELKPAGAVAYVDGQRKGTGAKAILLTVTPGKHKVKATYKGDTVEDVVVVKKGAVTSWTQVFEEEEHPKEPAAEKAADPPKGDAAPKGDDGPKGDNPPKKGDEPFDP